VTTVVIALFVLLLGVLVLVSYTARLYSEAGKFLSREFQENIEYFEQHIEPRLRVSRQRASLSMALLEQITITSQTLLVAFAIERENGHWQAAELGETAVLIIFVIVVFQRFFPYLLFVRTRGQWLSRFVPVLVTLIYLCMPLTLVLGFLQSVVSLTREHADEEPEHPSEAVDALIEAGQDEGILEESDRELIHSVIEFGDKMVREVMTPRPDVVAVPAETTIAELTDLLREHGYSRIPVYEGDIDHIVGIIFSHEVLQVPDTEAHTRTVRELMSKDVYLVPETKRGSELLREMQRQNVRMAIVIDEYGGVAGVVTIEDLVEEIVGELRDEDEARDVVREKDHSYIVPGGMDVDRLDDLFDIRRGDWEATTIGGLVTEFAGHIPAPGEVIEREGLRFEVLQSTQRRVERVRVSLLHREEVHQPEKPESGQRKL
jgi:CBS domain containing-hemolysin-like protein